MLLRDCAKLSAKLNSIPTISRGLSELFQDHVSNIMMRLFYHHGINGVGWYLDIMNYSELTNIIIWSSDYTTKDTYRENGGWGEQVTKIEEYHEVNMCMMRDSWGFLLRKTCNLTTGELSVCWRSIA